MTSRRLEAARIWHYVALCPWPLCREWALTADEDTITTYINSHPDWRNTASGLHQF